MRVTVRLGEPFWRTIDVRAVELSLPAGARVSDALDALVARYPILVPDLRDGEARPAMFLDDAEAQLNTRLIEGATLHIVWTVSGG